MRSLELLLSPKSIAVIGASARAGSVGSNLIINLQHSGFSGPIYPINPRYGEIHGLKAFKSIADVGPVDAAFIAVAAGHAPNLVRDAIAAGARSLFVNAAGFSEMGAEGADLQRQITEVARAAGVPLCGPNNLGLINLVDGVPLWTAHLPAAQPGSVAVVSQSGSVALALGEDIAGLGLSHVITAGSEAVTGIADYLLHLAGDRRVQIVLLFVESIRDPAAFAEAAAKSKAAGQHIVAVKVGRSEAARAAVAAHSGALSGEDAVIDAFFEQTGIIRARSIDDMVQLAVLLQHPAPPSDARAAFITLSGGQAAAIADFAADARYELTDFPTPVSIALAPHNGGHPIHNPLDAWGLGWDPQRFEGILKGLIAADGVDPIIFTLDIPATGGADGPMAAEMIAIAAQQKRAGKTIILCANSGISGVAKLVETAARSARIPVLLGLDAGLRTLARWRTRSTPGLSILPPATPGLSRIDAERQLREIVPFAQSVSVPSAERAVEVAAQMGTAIVLKGIAPAAQHKTELGLVRVGLERPDQIRDAFDEIARNLALHRAKIGEGHIELQRFIPKGVELLVAARRDPIFGPMVILGAGGKLVELLADSILRLGEIDKTTADAMLAATRLDQLLSGYRGSEPSDRSAALAAVASISSVLCAAGPEVSSIEINPLIVLPSGQGVAAVDLIIE